MQVKVAFVHDWLVTYRGGEKVLEALTELFPDAPIYTLFAAPENLPLSLQRKKIVVHPLFKYFTSARKIFLPLMPAAIESFPLEDFDLVISSSSCVAKGALVGPKAKHICYIHSPMRYIWDQRDEYFARFDRIPGLRYLAEFVASRLRIWDVASSPRVDCFIANSHFVRQRVERFYSRSADVVHPPLDSSFHPPQEKTGDYYLACGAFVSYKRFDLAIQACEATGRKLVVAGSGPMEASLRRLAGPNTRFIHAPAQEEWVRLMQQAKAVLYPGVEDFGMTGIESLACGTPVIALRQGGALDFVRDRSNGVFFERSDVESLQAALKAFESYDFSVDEIYRSSESFHKESFQRKVSAIIDRTIRG